MIAKILNWIINNKEWIFSGIGITIFSLFCVSYKKIISFFKIVYYKVKRYFHKNKTKQKTDKNIHDDSLFISESPADGIIIPVGKIFVKTWTIKNNGDVLWENRTLRCVEYAKNVFYPLKLSVKIPPTLPGEIITIKVQYYAKGEGDFRSRWKMYDKNNNLIYPQKSIGLGINVMVRNKKIFHKLPTYKIQFLLSISFMREISNSSNLSFVDIITSKLNGNCLLMPILFSLREYTTSVTATIHISIYSLLSSFCVSPFTENQ